MGRGISQCDLRFCKDIISELLEDYPSTFCNTKDYVMRDIATIYLLEASTGQYKIGRTTNLQRRTQEFGVKLPFDTDVIQIIEVTKDKAGYYEKWLHNYFADKHIQGEWFNLDYYSLKLLVDCIQTEGDLARLIWFEDESGIHPPGKNFDHISKQRLFILWDDHLWTDEYE